jgi:peptidoglycan/LPS O-acetylase OafA/YrhL
MKRFPALDGLRAVSILAVLSTHMLPLGPKALLLNDTAGAMGMTLFFALSGFLITSNLLAGQGVQNFFVRRLTRILPLAYLYLFIVLLIITYKPEMIPANLLFIENYADSYLSGLNAHFWSLCVEIHFYFSMGLVVAIFGVRGIWLVFPACLAVTAMRISEGAIIDIRTHLRVDEILAGACVAILYQKGVLKFQSSTGWMMAAVAFWFACSSPFAGLLQYLRPYSSAILLAVTIGLSPGIIRSGLASRPARYVAEISYALYVIHPATIYGWMNEGSSLERYLLKRPISIALTFLLAHSSTFYWESRWIAWGKGLTHRNDESSRIEIVPGKRTEG